MQLKQPYSKQDKARDYRLRRTYGITLAQYNNILMMQRYGCAVCGKSRQEEGRNLAVDHDHKTGELFGLLCFRCNHILIGKIRNPDLYLAASEYLKSGLGFFIPKKVKTKKKRRKAKK